jgi:predicted metal-dependent peptidase
MFLPSVERFGAGNIVVINDSSGSCTREAPKFFTEINAVSEDYSPDSITVITFDTVVQDVAEYTAGETIEGLSTKGGGGTNILPAFDYIEEHGLNPDAVIVFTDLYLWDWPEEPDYPVLWITTGRTDAPFGEVASMH